MWERGGSQSPRCDIYLKLKFPALIIPILDSVSFRGLPLAPVSEYIALFRQHGMWEGGGRKPKLSWRYLPKIEVRIAVYPSFSFRQLPWDSVDYHLLIYCWNLDNVVCGSGGGGQSTWANIYLKFKFAELPSASVGFLGLPSPHILPNSDNAVCGRGADAKVPDAIFT